MFASDPKFWKVLKAGAIPWFATLGLVLLAILVVAWFRKRYRDREDREAAAHQMLMEFRELHRGGDLSEEEYRSIKNRLVQQIGRSADRPAEAGEASDGGAAEADGSKRTEEVPGGNG